MRPVLPSYEPRGNEKSAHQCDESFRIKLNVVLASKGIPRGQGDKANAGVCSALVRNLTETAPAICGETISSGRKKDTE
jgi:hypothetical protein